ncbi:MAG: GDSL-type esterase/lipase family protein [Lacipirellulaceae bacterium]
MLANRLLVVGLALLSVSATAAEVDDHARTPETIKAAKPRFAAELREFERADLRSPPAPGGVVFVGSSSIRLWDLPRSFPDVAGPVRNRGFGGSHLSDSVENIDLLVLRHKPRCVVLYAGDNDLAEGKSPERVAADFDRFATLVQAALPSTRILYVSIKPSLQRWELASQQREANRRIRARCDADPRLRYVDVWPAMLGPDGRPRSELLVEDGLHLSDEGYRLWTELVGPALDEVAPAAGRDYRQP